MAKKHITRRNFIIGGSAFLAYLLWGTSSIAVRKYTIKISGLPREFEGLTILHLSDLHSKWFGEKQNRLLKTINKEHFDLVVITGDLVNKKDPEPEPALELIKGLRNKSIFFVPGNHEWWSGYTIREPLLSLGVNILENKSFKLTKGHSHLWITGVDDPYTGRDELDKALRNANDGQPIILLAHAPEIFPQGVNSQVELILVGHTHGGQIRLPFIGAVIVPGQKLFPQYDYGLYSEGKSKMIITGGLGESGLPIRFNIRPEIVFVTLTSK
jgi:predicted MPP superfamily phosphohydrolase